MVAMAAIVAQNGATGQSLVEQFTTGNLNPFIGGYAKQVRRGKELKLAGVFVSFVSPIFWVDLDFFTWWRRSQKDFCQVHQDLYHDHFGRQLATFDWTPCFETVTKQHVFSNQAASPPDIYKKTSSQKKLLPNQ